MIYSINHFGYENVKDISREVEVHRTVENEVVNRNPPSIQHKWCFGCQAELCYTTGCLRFKCLF